MKCTDRYSSLASNVRRKHTVLVLTIGTFAEEDESYKLLNRLSVSIPFIVIVDALLVAAYLWIIGQEVKSLPVKKTLLYQEGISPLAR